MRFFIDFDQGDRLGGWVIPDNPMAVSRVAVSVDGRRVAEISANLIDRGFVERGWHSTGQCTFWIMDEHVPGLASIPRLEVHDLDTNVLVHRRVPKEEVI